VAPTVAQRRAIRFRSQLLDRRGTDPLVFIRKIALYSTAPTSHLALAARVKGYRVEHLERLVADRQIVAGGGVRGSGFFVPVELIPMTVAVGADRRARLEREILDKRDNRKAYDRLSKRVERALDGTEMAGADIRKAVRPTEAEAFVYSWTLRLMAERCRIVPTSTTGSWKSNRFVYRLWDEWLPHVDPFGMDEEAARAELARVYFEAHGPATIEDFRWWSGLGPHARNAVEAAAVPERGDGYFGTTRRASAPTGVRLLPIWDATFLTHRDRTHVIADARYGSVYDTSGNPTSVVLVDGRAAGVWTMVEDKKRLRVAAAPFASFPARTWTAIGKEAELIADAIAVPDLEIIRVKKAPSIAAAPRNFFMSPLRDHL